MKKWKKALVSVLTGCLMVGMLPEGAQATAPAETPYTYTFTLSAGDKGLINGQEKVRVSKLKLGDSVNLFENFYDQISLNAEDDKYYVKGFRLSGRDNQDMKEGANDILSPVVTVTGDMDYVVAYGIKGDQVSYQVRYQDEDGNELAPTRTYYGNIGDKPIVAYHYIDGYIPQALALTKTLGADASENIFTFVYVQGDPSDIVNHVTETTTVDGTQVVTVVRPAQSAGGTGGGAGGGTGQTGAGGAEDTTTETETIEEDQTPQGSQDIVDLDEEDTPLGDLELDEDKIEESSKGFPLALSIGIGAVAAVVLICLVIWLIKGRKAGKDGNTEE